MDSYDILVIILSITLAIFLVLAIFSSVLFIQLLKKLQATTDVAQKAVEDVQSITGSAKNIANGSALLSLFANIANRFKSGHKSVNKGDNDGK